MLLLTTLTLCCLAVALVYAYLVCNYDHWQKRGIIGPKPKLLFGTFPWFGNAKNHIAADINDIYNAYKSRDKFVGVFFMRRPVLMVTDALLVREVLANSFEHFSSNDITEFIDTKKDPLIANNPFLLDGHQWRKQRDLLIPALSPSRIKVTYTMMMQNVCQKFCQYIQLRTQMANKDGINAKDLALRFTSESTADCVLGLKAKSFFLQSIVEPIALPDNVTVITKMNFTRTFYFMIVALFPWFVKFHRLKWMSAASEKFFSNLMQQAFPMRLGSVVERRDVKNYLLSLQEGEQLNNEQLASVSMTFMYEGSDTVASAISSCLLLLAREQGSQVKLRDEIMAIIELHGELSFEHLNELPYLNACIHEALRIFPPIMWSSKNCTKPHIFTNANGRPIQMNVGDKVLLPLYSIHHDASYYDEPEQFRPERFLPENGGVERYVNAGVYYAFGDGPRKCLGMDFALVQTRAAISTIIKHFHIFPNAKTNACNSLEPMSMVATPKDGVWLDFEKLS